MTVWIWNCFMFEKLSWFLKKSPKTSPPKTKFNSTKMNKWQWYSTHVQRKSSWCKLLLPAISMLQDPLRCLEIQKEQKRLSSVIPYFHIILLCSLLWTECSVVYTVPASATLHGQISSTALLRINLEYSQEMPRVLWIVEALEEPKKSRGVKKYFEIVCSAFQCLVIHQ